MGKWIIPAVFVLLWSSGAIFVEWGLQDASPMAFLSLRHIWAMVPMWGISLCLRPAWPRDRSDWRDVIITGLTMQVGYQLFFFLALDADVSPGLLSIVLGAQPLLTAALSRESVGGWQWLGLVMGMMGLTLVVVHVLWAGTVTLRGITCAILALLCITFGTMWQKRVTINLLINMTIQYTVGSMVLTALAVVAEDFSVRWTGGFVMSLAWMSWVISVGATLLLFIMIRKGNLTNVTSWFYLVPPVTACLDFLIFGHVLRPAAVAGMGLIIVGLVLVNQMDR